MKINVLKISFILLLLGSCIGSKKNTNVSIERVKDTISIDEIYSANLYVPHMDTIFSEFYIIRNSDTLLLPYDDKIGAAVFKAIGRKKGEKLYYGEVNYVNKSGDQVNEKFEINFAVK